MISFISIANKRRIQYFQHFSLFCLFCYYLTSGTQKKCQSCRKTECVESTLTVVYVFFVQFFFSLFPINFRHRSLSVTPPLNISRDIYNILQLSQLWTRSSHVHAHSAEKANLHPDIKVNVHTNIPKNKTKTMEISLSDCLARSTEGCSAPRSVTVGLRMSLYKLTKGIRCNKRAMEPNCL